MDTSWETTSMSSEEEEEEPEVRHQKEDPGLSLANMTVEGELRSYSCLSAADFNRTEHLKPGVDANLTGYMMNGPQIIYLSENRKSVKRLSDRSLTVNMIKKKILLKVLFSN